MTKLSFCIATRNRADFIGETLASIATQCDGRGDEVEIIVLDGASTDNTAEVIGKLQSSFPFIHYFRQESNGGVDRDYDATVGLARGEYCWLMSDDDLIKPGAVDLVLKAVSRGYSLIIVNADLWTFDFSTQIDANRLHFESDRTYPPADFCRLFEETSAYLTYIGAVVIRREIWQSRQREAYFGSYFIHVGVIFQEQLPGETFVIGQPLVAIRFGNTQWRPREFEIRMIRWPELIWSLPAIPEAVRSRVYRRVPWRSLKSLLFYRAKGTYDMGDYRRWIEPRATSFKDKALAVGIARLPGTLANLIGLVFCGLFKYRDSNVHFLDMKISRFYFGRLFKRKPAS
ncbi:MAG: glycosyltransferase family 2 protein [Xanthomonadaceae bacterium]|nr:glycosyltransferase family 2 protein [Xanthomonadaceae bacterium]